MPKTFLLKRCFDGDCCLIAYFLLFIKKTKTKQNNLHTFKKYIFCAVYRVGVSQILFISPVFTWLAISWKLIPALKGFLSIMIPLPVPYQNYLLATILFCGMYTYYFTKEEYQPILLWDQHIHFSIILYIHYSCNNSFINNHCNTVVISRLFAKHLEHLESIHFSTWQLACAHIIIL